MAESHCSIITADLQGIETETERKSTNCFRSCREVASNDGRVYCHHRQLLPNPKERHSSLSIGFSGTFGRAVPFLFVLLKSFSAERGHYK